MFKGLDIPPHSLVVMSAVFVLLVIASVVSGMLVSRDVGKDYIELRLRIRSWWWIVLLIFGSLLVSQTAAIVLFAFISFLALKEFFSIVPTRMADRRVIFWAYMSIPMQYYWIVNSWYGMFIIFIPIYIFLLLPMRMVLIGETKGFIKAVGITHWAVMLSVFCLSHTVYLLVLPEKNSDAGAMGLVIFLLFATQFNDVSQYIWGKMFGRHKIIPRVSPNKTWEGFIGGMVTIVIVAGVMAPYLTPLSVVEGLLAGLIISIAGFVGDVVISSVKRDLNIKDSGTLIPGHGGVLDRLDSLMFTAPLFFHYLYYMVY
jgi:phosphatidate cytidylyltransferase